MDREVELNYRLTGHLQDGEHVLATLISREHGIYAATNRRILCLNTERIGYCIRVHPYCELTRIDCFPNSGGWVVQFASPRGELSVEARSAKEARKFVDVACERLVEAGELVD